MNITQVMNKLYERDYIDKLHRSIKEGLVGSLRQEYLMQKPLREPYEKYVAEVNEFVSLPIFHALVDMMTASLLHSVSKDLVGEVLNTIDELNTLSKPSMEEITRIIFDRLILKDLSGDITSNSNMETIAREIAQEIYNLSKVRGA